MEPLYRPAGTTIEWPVSWEHVLDIVNDAAVAAQRAHDAHGSDATGIAVWLVQMVREDLRQLHRQHTPHDRPAPPVGPGSYWR